MLEKKHMVYGTYYKSATFHSDRMYQLDACKLGDTKKVLEEVKPEIVIWSIMSGPTETKTMKISLREVLDYTKERDSRVIYISTDLFKGEQSYYKEDYEAIYFDNKNPYAPYFNGKVLGEQMVLGYKDNIVVRIGMIYGLDYFNKYDKRISRMLKQLNNNEKIELNKNMYKTYTNIRFSVEVIMAVIDIEYQRILHVVNTKRLSVYDFYKQQLAEIGMISDLFIKKYIDEVEAKENDLSLDTSMSNCKLLRLMEEGQICTSYNKMLSCAPYIHSL